MTEPNLRTYKGWTEALGSHYFSEANAGLPVTYFVDDDALAEIAGMPAREAVESLSRAVHGQLIRADDENPFVVIERYCQQWVKDGYQGFPPSLPLLAVAVLAATRMAESGHIHSNDYYNRFWPLVGLEKSNTRYRGYGETLPTLWTQLDRWLDKVQRGARGRSTIAEHAWWTRIGYALSQALFRTSDRHKLYRFFTWIGLKPGAPIQAAELLAYYRVWVRDSNLSPGAKRMAADTKQEEQLLRLLHDMAEAWDGTPRDALGRREALAHAALDFSENPIGKLWIVVERPGGAPAPAEIEDQARVLHVLDGSQPGWYDHTFLPITRDFLDGDWRAAGDALSVRGPDGPVYVLTETDLDIPVTVPRAQLHAEHFVLVRDDWRKAVDDHLKRFASANWQEYRPEGLPSGWVARRRVVFPVVPAVEVEPELRCLIPRPSARPSLWGGLPMAGRGVYLRGGEPDLIVSGELAELIPEVRIGTNAFNVPPEGLEVSLSNLGLPVGQHEITGGPTPLRFETLETIGAIRASGCGSVVQRIPCDGLGPLSAPGAIEIAGAVVTDHSGCLRHRTPPMLVPRGREVYILIGACPGEIAEVREPGVPSWTRQVGIYPRYFEVAAPFPVVWLLMRRTSGQWEARARIQLKPGRLPLPDATEEQLQGWAEALNHDPVVESQSRPLWDLYRNAATQFLVIDEPQPVS